MLLDYALYLSVLFTEITVNPGYLVGRPIGYVNQERFIQEFEGKVEKKVPGFNKNVISMDTTPEGDEARHQKKGRHRKHVRIKFIIYNFLPAWVEQ